MKKAEIALLKEIKQFIDSNLDSEIPVKGLCSKFAINRNKLQSGFKYLYSQTVHAYILQRRMEQAAEKLAATEYPVKAIALDMGYTASNFHSKFKKKFGCSPEQFRKMMRMPKGIQLIIVAFF
jgi:AraC-like DNA-binding protein